MAEWAFTIATNEYSCPKCLTKKGYSCETPKGFKCNKPHKERVKQLNKKDWDRCKTTRKLDI